MAKRILLIILAILLPPVAVIVVEGVGFHLLLNIILLIVTLDVGAIIHAVYLVVRQEQAAPQTA